MFGLRRFLRPEKRQRADTPVYTDWRCRWFGHAYSVDDEQAFWFQFLTRTELPRFCERCGHQTVKHPDEGLPDPDREWVDA